MARSCGSIAPDFRPSVESFDLAAALANPADSPKLQPLDTVPYLQPLSISNPLPTVWVGGEVRDAGKVSHLGAGASA